MNRLLLLCLVATPLFAANASLKITLLKEEAHSGGEVRVAVTLENLESFPRFEKGPTCHWRERWRVSNPALSLEYADREAPDCKSDEPFWEIYPARASITRTLAFRLKDGTPLGPLAFKVSVGSLEDSTHRNLLEKVFGLRGSPVYSADSVLDSNEVTLKVVK